MSILSSLTQDLTLSEHSDWLRFVNRLNALVDAGRPNCSDHNERRYPDFDIQHPLTCRPSTHIAPLLVRPPQMNHPSSGSCVSDLCR